MVVWRHQPLIANDPVQAWQGLLKARNLKEKDKFFTPALSDLPDPFLMQDMDLAASRLVRAIQKKEKIHVFGDFDCDGVSGTCVLVEALRAIGADVGYSIPHRVNDGHGIGMDALQSAMDTGAVVGLSVDTGTTCFEACDYAMLHGFDFIITDHHLPDKTLPRAFAILNPARDDCGFADRQLCGTGVAFFLLVAVWKQLGKQGQRPDYDLKQLLDRVAVATIADVMPLQGVNRVLVHFGLRQLKTAPSIGMSALMDTAKVNKNRISAETVAFYLAPRINAAGRMQHGEDAMRLLCCQDEQQAKRLALVLDGLNQERRKIESDTFKQATAKLKLAYGHTLAVYDQTWHAGVVGLVAGRLARQYGRPAAVGFVDTMQHIRVSLRGVCGFHVGNLLYMCSEYLDRFGGHAGAGGGTVKKEAWPGFVAAFDMAVQKQQAELKDQPQTLPIDGALSLQALHHGLASRLARFEPLGQGNPACVWLIHQVTIADFKKLKGGVCRLMLTDGQRFVPAVLFRHLGAESLLQQGLTVSLLGQLQKDTFRGAESIQFVIEDMLL